MLHSRTCLGQDVFKDDRKKMCHNVPTWPIKATDIAEGYWLTESFDISSQTNEQVRLNKNTTKCKAATLTASLKTDADQNKDLRKSEICVYMWTCKKWRFKIQ